VSHKGHPTCEHNSKAACDKARRVAIGQCVSMLDENRQCPHWGIDRVDDKPYCGQHINSVYLAAAQARLDADLRAAVTGRIDAYLDKTGQVPHVCGERCQFSQVPISGGPRTVPSESISQPEVPLF
jgi:hypothetical protein